MRHKPPANEDLDEDQILWRRVTQRVKPLPGRKQAISALSTVRKPLYLAKTAPKISKKTILRSDPYPTPVKPPSPIDLRDSDRGGLDGRTHRRLSRGDVPIDRRLDLHGHTAVQAELKLRKFLEDAFYGGCRCVLVITGKGAGVLKGHMPGWLRRAPLSELVLAFVEARPADGGGGAFYVLFRRRR